MKRPKRKVQYYSPKRRHAMSLGEDIRHVEIFERDGWMCWLCNKPIDRKLRCPSWWAATLDHVYPLNAFQDPAQWHTAANVRAAHALCNFKKADKIIEGSTLTA